MSTPAHVDPSHVDPPHVDPPIGVAEVHRLSRDDARRWSALQGLRRADRRWQRTVGHRPSPYLLPDRHER